MATTTGVRLTKAGEDLLVKVHSGEVDKLKLKGFVLGSGVWTKEEIEKAELTALKEQRVSADTLEMQTGTGAHSGRLICSGVVRNTGVTEAFYVREIGLTAENENGEDILYLIDPIAADAPTTVIESNIVQQDVPIRMELVAVSRDQVELILSSGAELVTPTMMEDAINKAKEEIISIIGEMDFEHIDAEKLQGKVPSDFALWDHAHNDDYYQKTEMDTKLNGKANTSHTHTKNQITDFPTSLSPSAHTHSKAEITDFPATMPPSTHTHSKSQITDFPATMPPSAHSHTKADVGLGNVDNVKQFSTSNPPPYPVTKVNGMTGEVIIRATDVGLDNVLVGTTAFSNQSGTTPVYFILQGRRYYINAYQECSGYCGSYNTCEDHCYCGSLQC